MAAVARAGARRRSRNAACEPHVQDLCRFLVALGAQIDGIGSNVLHDQRRRAAARRRAPRSRPDHIEVGSFIGLAAVTGGELHDRRRRARRPRPILPVFERLGVARRGRRRRLCACRRARTLVITDDLGGAIPKIEDGPWPAFPADLTSIARRRRDAGARHRPDLREDVREPPVLRRQAGRDGRADHPLRPAPRRRHGPGEALRPAHVEPRHPRRHGDADRRAVRRGQRRRSATSARSTAATSASTSGCARSARTSSARSSRPSAA